MLKASLESLETSSVSVAGFVPSGGVDLKMFLFITMVLVSCARQAKACS